MSQINVKGAYGTPHTAVGIQNSATAAKKCGGGQTWYPDVGLEFECHSMNSLFLNHTLVKRPRRYLVLLVTTMVLESTAALAPSKIDLTELEFRHGIAFFHDLKYPADFEHLDYVNPDAPKGGTLVLPTQTSFNTLSPGTSQTTTAPGLSWTFDTLLTRAGDEVSEFYGRLASGIAITPDERTVVIRIHQDARWHDGVPVTSADVVFSLEYMLSRVELAAY